VIDVTVMMPVYNAMPFLPDAVDSVLRQDFSGSRELLIINDGSTDEGGAYLDRLDPRVGNWEVRVIHQEHSGLGVTRTTLLREARGRFLISPDADDVIPQGTIGHILDAFARTGAGLVYTDHQQMAEDGKLGAVVGKSGLHSRLREIIYHNFFCQHLKAFDADQIRGFGFDPDLRSAQDYDFVLQILPHVEIAHVPVVGCYFRDHPNSQYSRTRKQARQWARSSVERHVRSHRLYGDRDVRVERVEVEGGSYFEHFVEGQAQLSAENRELLQEFLR